MRYISLFIGGVLSLAACNTVKVDGNGEYGGIVTAGFQDTVVTTFETAGTEALTINLSQAVSVETKIRVEVCEEYNIRENEGFLLVEKELTVAPGEKTATVQYTLIDDDVENGGRSFSIKLLSVNGGLVDSSKEKVRVNVLDDESDVAIAFEQTAVSCREREIGGTTASYTFKLPVQLLGKFTKPLQYKIALYPVQSDNAAKENIHFQLSETTFVVNSAAEALNIPIEIIDDAEVNENRTFVLEITEVSGGKIYTAGKRCVVTIVNDDQGIYFTKNTVVVEERAGVVKVPIKTIGLAEEEIRIKLEPGGDAVENTDYRLTTTEYTIQPGQDSVEVEVTLLYPEARVSPDRTLNLRITDATGAQIFGEENCEVRILDCDSKIAFSKEKDMVLNDDLKMQVPVTLSEAVGHDVKFKVNITSLVGLTEGQVTVVNPDVTIPAGSTSATVELALKKLTLRNKANFTLEFAKAYGASSGLACTISKYYRYEKTDLSIAGFSSEEKTGEGAGNGTAANAIDGDTGKFWHSIWNGGTSKLPEGIVVKLPERIRVMAVEVIKRIGSDNSDTKEITLYMSDNTTEFLRDDNGTAWGNPIGKMEWTAKNTNLAESTKRATMDTPLTGKYLKVAVTNGFRQFGQIAELYVYGYTE